MDDPVGAVPGQIDIGWEAGERVGAGDPGTVEEATLALVSLGVSPESLSQLHEQGLAPGTPAVQVDSDVWQEVVSRLSPQDVAVVAQLNGFFHRLAHQGSVPLADPTQQGVVHVHNAVQLATALGRDDVTHIAVHANVNGALVGAAAADTEKTLLLGPGATATDITGGTVEVFSGGTATGISGGDVTVWDGGTATGVTGGIITLFQGGNVSVPADIELHQDTRQPKLWINGADQASSTLFIIQGAGAVLHRS